jgi:hypothetical protein
MYSTSGPRPPAVRFLAGTHGLPKKPKNMDKLCTNLISHQVCFP